jgi:peptidylprolyl isomerase
MAHDKFSVSLQRPEPARLAATVWGSDNPRDAQPAPPISSLSSLASSSPIPSSAPLPKPTSRALAVAPCYASSSSAPPPCNVQAAPAGRRGLLALSAGFLTSAALLGQAFDAEATRIEYYATVGDKMCDMNLVKSGLAYCDVEVGTGAQPPRGELINASTGTKRFRLVSLRIRMLISFPLLFAKDQIAVL